MSSLAAVVLLVLSQTRTVDRDKPFVAEVHSGEIEVEMDDGSRERFKIDNGICMSDLSARRSNAKLTYCYALENRGDELMKAAADVYENNQQLRDANQRLIDSNQELQKTEKTTLWKPLAIGLVILSTVLGAALVVKSARSAE